MINFLANLLAVLYEVETDQKCISALFHVISRFSAIALQAPTTARQATVDSCNNSYQAPYGRNILDLNNL